MKCVMCQKQHKALKTVIRLVSRILIRNFSNIQMIRQISELVCMASLRSNVGVTFYILFFQELQNYKVRDSLDSDCIDSSVDVLFSWPEITSPQDIYEDMKYLFDFEICTWQFNFCFLASSASNDWKMTQMTFFFFYSCMYTIL